jgi:hypothetical protein
MWLVSGITGAYSDQFGLYITEKRRIDDGMTDPNRCAGSRIKLG